MEVFTYGQVPYPGKVTLLLEIRIPVYFRLQIVKVCLVVEYSNRQNTKFAWYSNGIFVSGCQMVWYWNGGLKTGLKKAFLGSKMLSISMVPQVTSLYHLNTRHPYCPVFRWLLYFRFQMASIKKTTIKGIQKA